MINLLLIFICLFVVIVVADDESLFNLIILPAFRGVEGGSSSWPQWFSCQSVGACLSSPCLGCIDNLTRIDTIIFEQENLRGYIPMTIANLTSLRVLRLSHNWMRATLPFALFQLPQLLQLNLQTNRFSGYLPTIWSSPSLQYVTLHENNFTSHPSSNAIALASNASLNSCILVAQYSPLELNCYDCPFDVPVKCKSNLAVGLNPCPRNYPCINSTWQQSAAPDLDFQLNYMTSVVYPLMAIGMSNGSSINFTCSEITPCTPPPCVSCHFGSVTHLNFDNSSLNGIIIATFFLILRDLVFLSLANNNLGGSLPPILYSSRLNVLRLSRNRLSGTVPIAYGQLTMLTAFDISYNRISGTLPQFVDSKFRLIMRTEVNELRGALVIADAFDSLQLCRLIDWDDMEEGNCNFSCVSVPENCMSISTPRYNPCEVPTYVGGCVSVPISITTSSSLPIASLSSSTTTTTITGGFSDIDDDSAKKDEQKSTISTIIIVVTVSIIAVAVVAFAIAFFCLLYRRHASRRMHATTLKRQSDRRRSMSSIHTAITHTTTTTDATASADRRSSRRSTPRQSRRLQYALFTPGNVHSYALGPSFDDNDYAVAPSVDGRNYDLAPNDDEEVEFENKK